jgi:hypothetical protein
MQIDGTWYSDRTEVTRQLVLRFSVVKPGDTRVIGLFGGFRMAIRSHVKRDFGKRLVLLGNVEHEAGHTDNPNGFIRVLENLMNRMEAAARRGPRLPCPDREADERPEVRDRKAV